jgi:hypothetical protein
MPEMLRERLRTLWGWLLQRQPKLDYARDYWEVLVKQWNEHLFETTSPIGVAFILWWITGSPPVNFVLCVVVWVFLLAGYYAWREEHLKNVSDDFTGYIYGAATMIPTSDAQLLGEHWVKVFVGVRINNVGTPRSIHTWQVSWRKGPGQPGFHLADGMLFNGQVGNLPEGIRGYNLHGDTRLFASGETRDGWIAFDGNADFEAEMLPNLSLGFTDAFNKFHEVSSLSDWAIKRKL